MTDGKARILVVDDNDATRYMVARALRADASDVREAATGKEALESARAWNPDVMVLDVHLPDILGFEVAEKIKADPKTSSIAILHLSASFTGPDAQVQGLQRGADAYLVHPVEPQVLRATAQALFRMHQAQQREREARERAEASESRYRFLADMVPHLIWSADASGHIDYMNHRWLEFCGGQDEEPDPGDWRENFHPEDRQRFFEAWQRSLATSQPLEIECRRFSPPAGAYRWLLIRARPMRDNRGRVVRWFGTSTDIQAQKDALAERERLLGELREEARRKNDFLAMLSHELRNPLMPIRNSVYVLGRANATQAQRARDVIDRQTRHMTRLVDDLLDVTRISRGKIQLRKEDVELNGLIRRAVDDHRGFFTAAGVQIELREYEQPLTVEGDPTRLAQVIGNLLHNAAKFTPPGGKVRVSLEPQACGAAILRVTDTGSGIPPETLSRVFEPFVQADKTLDRSRGGLGLGLALAKGIVDLHGGNIRAASEGLGRGSEFTVKLPLARALHAQRPISSPSAGRPGPHRILVIEDNADAAESLKEALEISHHAVEVAHDGSEGVERARELRPDIVLCDIGLPRMDGYEVARRLRKEPDLDSTLLIALSGYALQEDVERSREAGFDRHIAKPPSLDELERLIEQAPVARGGANGVANGVDRSVG